MSKNEQKESNIIESDLLHDFSQSWARDYENKIIFKPHDKRMYRQFKVPKFRRSLHYK